MDVITYPNEILRTPSVDITDIGSDRVNDIISDMVDCLETKGGLGLSACQIGLNENLFICKLKIGLLTIINPIVIAQSGHYWSRGEGCLSLPDTRKDIKRKKLFKIKYFDIDGKEQMLKREKFEAAILQHEMDHLKGKLIIDY
jgi:peptide deformylase